MFKELMSHNKELTEEEILENLDDIVYSIKTPSGYNFQYFEGVFCWDMPFKIHVVSSDFRVQAAKISNNKNFPTVIAKDLTIINVDFLEGYLPPTTCYGDIFISDLKLTNMKGIQKYIYGDFVFSESKLKTTRFIPLYIDGSLNLSYNNIKYNTHFMILPNRVASMITPEKLRKIYYERKWERILGKYTYKILEVL